MARGIEVGTAWVSLTVSAKGIGKDIEKELAPVGRETEKASREAGQGLDSIATKALAVGIAGGAALFGLADAAGSLNAAIQTSDRVFGDAASSVQAFAADTSDAVFLSETAALQAANGFGIFATQAGMSKSDAASFGVEMVQLAADLAAVADVPVSQAVQDLSSAFAGSTETMQKYGINLNETELKAQYFAQTGERITGVMTASQKTMAVYWALLEKGAFAFGAADSEADQFASQVDRLKGLVGNVAADFGQPVVDFASGLLGAVSGGLEDLQKWNEETGGMLASGVAAGIGVAAVGSGFIGIAGKAKSAFNAIKEWNRITKLGVGIAGGLGLAVTAGFIAYGLMTSHSREVAARTKEVSDAFRDATIEALGLAEGAEAAALALGLASVNPELEQSLGTLGLQVSDLGQVLLDLGEDPLEVVKRLAQEAGIVDPTAIDLMAEAIVNFGGRSSDVADDTNQLANAFLNVLLNSESFVVHEEDAAMMAQMYAEQLLGTAHALENLYDESDPERQQQVAAEFLNSAVAASDYGAELVAMAEKQTGANRTGDEAFAVYLALQNILADMTPEQRAAAEEALGLADAQSEAAAATEDVNTVAANSIDLISDVEDAFNNAADAVNAFRSGLDRFIDPAIALSEANDALIAGWAEMDQVIADVEEGVEGATTSLTGFGIEGAENRRMFEDQVVAIADYGEALLESGAGVDNAAQSMRTMREQLIRQAEKFLGSRKAAEDYVNSLGLTPESIETAVELYGDELAKQRIEEYQAELGDIDAEVATRIEALIDAGKYNEAKRLLDQLARDRSLKLYVNAVTSGVGGGRGGGGGRASYQADGGYATSATLSVWGEDGPEWIAPLSKPHLMRKWLDDDRIRRPVMEALDLQPQLVGVGSGGRTGPLVDTMNVYESNGSSVEEQLSRIMFRQKVGAP